MRALLRRGQVWWLTVATGGSVLVLDGCDPSVRDTILGGVEGAATTLFGTFINAFFQTLQPEEETVTTVKAILDYLPQCFA